MVIDIGIDAVHSLGCGGIESVTRTTSRPYLLGMGKHVTNAFDGGRHGRMARENMRPAFSSKLDRLSQPRWIFEPVRSGSGE